MAAEGSQFDARQFDAKMTELLGTEQQEFFTSYDEVHDSFDAMGLQENLLRGIYAYGFEKPSAIQQRGIVPFCKGLDVIQQAQSGTGKTATFCSGILQQLDYSLVECQALVLAPTRELAQQIEKVMRALGDYLGVKVHACVGGTSVREDQRILQSGVHGDCTSIMASIRRLARALHSHYRTLASPSLHQSTNLPHNGIFGCKQRTYFSRSVPSTTFPAILAGLFGVGVLNVAYADSDEAGAEVPPFDSLPIPSYNPLEETAKRERLRLENLLKSKGVKYGSYPRFTVAVKGQKVTIKFQIPPTCEIPLLIATLVSRLGVKLEDPSAASNMLLRAWDSGVAWKLALSRPQMKNGTAGEQAGGRDTNPIDEDLCILIFRPLINADKAEIEFMKPVTFTDEELDALAYVLQFAGQQKSLDLRSKGVPSADKTVTTLESMGVKIFGINVSTSGNPNANIAWENIAGYNQQKREIEDTILLALQSPEVYDDIARGTRCKFETNRPRAVLFEGPPGTGKTSCARVIANQAGVPLLYVPLEIIMSKYYGESERLLGKVFSLANDIPDGAIVFLDEVDSFATARDGETHEATRRLLSVLLRQIDGFEQEKKVVVVAATNRKQDLDPALISRFDSMITFPLPDQQTRQEIAAQYAKHLTDSELSEFARATEGLSGRDMRDVCQQAERHWASKIIRGQAPKHEGSGGSLPPLQDYIESSRNRQRALFDIEIQKRSMNPTAKKPLFDFA